MKSMMYTLDLTGHDEGGNPEIVRYGGLYLTADKASAAGRLKAATERLVFKPEMIWIRDQEGTQISKESILS